MLANKDFDYLQIAFYCGLLPLVGGIGTYILWLLTAWAFLLYFGFGVIWLGLFLVLIGFGCLANYLLNLGHTQGRGFGQRLRHAFLVTVLLLLNFPSAYFCVSSAFVVLTSYTLRISNESGQKIENLIILGPGLKQELGSLADSQQIKRHFHFRGDGGVNMKVVTTSAESTTQIDGYTTTNSGADNTVRIKPGLVVEVSGTYPVK